MNNVTGRQNEVNELKDLYLRGYMSNRMKRILTVVTLLALFISASCRSEDGWVKVEGNKFIDPQGNELIFRGLCFSDPVLQRISSE